ncbi:MAG: tetratricopeptide repeat protein [Candidatus Acidiferrum sp.]
MQRFLILLLCFCSNAGPARADSPYAAAKQVPNQADAFQRGLAALKENRLEDAFVELSAAEREHPDDARVRNFRGIVLTQMGKNDEAAAEYQESIRLDPLLEDAYRNLGFLRWTEHQLGPARGALERAVKLSSDDVFAHYYLGRVELDAQHYEPAFHELEMSRQQWSADAGFLIQVAIGYIALGRQEGARKSLDQLRKAPLSEAQSVQAVSLLLSVQENDAAINLSQKLNQDHSPAQPAWVQFDLALTYLLTGNYEKAVEQYPVYAPTGGSTHSENPESAQAWSLIGIAYAHLKQGERSVDALRRAAALEPGEEEHWLNLTRELMELNRYPEAITAVQSGLAANPKSYALHLRLGAAYLAAGRYAEAESVFRDLVAAGDPLPTGYIGLAQVLLRTGRAEEAAAELSAAEKKLGPKFLISYFRGLALDRSGKPAEALAAFQEAVRLHSNSAEAHLNLGKIELALGRVNEAIAELQESLHLDPGNRQAKRLLSQAYRRAGDAENAAKFAEASAEAPVAPVGDLIGDFFVPQWQVPPEGKGK